MFCLEFILCPVVILYSKWEYFCELSDQRYPHLGEESGVLSEVDNRDGLYSILLYWYLASVLSNNIERTLPLS